MREILAAATLCTGCIVADGTVQVLHDGLDENLWASVATVDVFVLEDTLPTGTRLECAQLLAGEISVDADPDRTDWSGPSPRDPVVLYSGRLRLPDGEAPPIGKLPPGRTLFYARARDRDCRVVAHGCTAVQLQTGEDTGVGVALAPAPRSEPCGEGEVCIDGVCAQCSGCADAGPDGGDADADAGPTEEWLLLNVDGTTTDPSPKTGPAAAGLGESDFWNAVHEPFAYDFVADGLRVADGSPTAASIRVSNLPGGIAWSSPPANGDAMYETFLYSQSGTEAGLTFYDLPRGRYTVYVYGHGDTALVNSVYEASVHDEEDGPALARTEAEATATDESSWDDSDWLEGGQYVALEPLDLAWGQILEVSISHGSAGYGTAGCVINGLQLVRDF